jgi:hypothetical protein
MACKVAGGCRFAFALHQQPQASAQKHLSMLDVVLVLEPVTQSQQ